LRAPGISEFALFCLLSLDCQPVPVSCMREHKQCLSLYTEARSWKHQQCD
jgi:hypothetical protein